MRAGGRVAITAILLVVTACGGTSSTTAGIGPSTSSATAPPTIVTPDFVSLAGAYTTASGVTYALNGHGHLANLADGWFRQLYATSTADSFTVGHGSQVAAPVEATVVFHITAGAADALTITPVSGSQMVAQRAAFKQTEVRVPTQGAMLAATITEPVTAGPHPAIVIVHGSGLGPRIDYGIWVALYAHLGMTVLAYDKRGNGDSTGQYPGELATPDNLNIYADDAAACLRFLTAWPGVDIHRVGFHGGSQGGWIVPLAIQRDPATAFAVLLSGPAVTTGQQSVWADFSGGSQHLPTASQEEMDAALAAEHSGYDPKPVLAATTTPIVWINGALDLQVPTALNTQILHSLHRANFEVQVLPGAGHSLLEDGDGLTSGDATAQRLAGGLFSRMATWLAAHVGTSAL